MTSLVGLYRCEKCLEICDQQQLRRDGCCPVCAGEVHVIKPQVERVITGIDREFGEYGVQK